MCKYCNPNAGRVMDIGLYALTNTSFDGGILGEFDLDLYIRGAENSLELCVADSLEARIPIRYCPMCGREL